MYTSLSLSLPFLLSLSPCLMLLCAPGTFFITVNPLSRGIPLPERTS